MVARIFKPAKSAMQSGTAQTTIWIMELEYNLAKTIDPLMGWTGSKDTRGQIQIRFNTELAAVNFAKDNGISFIVQKPNVRRHIVRENGYGENFRFDKKIPWTH